MINFSSGLLIVDWSIVMRLPFLLTKLGVEDIAGRVMRFPVLDELGIMFPNVYFFCIYLEEVMRDYNLIY